MGGAPSGVGAGVVEGVVAAGAAGGVAMGGVTVGGAALPGAAVSTAPRACSSVISRRHLPLLGVRAFKQVRRPRRNYLARSGGAPRVRRPVRDPLPGIPSR